MNQQESHRVFQHKGPIPKFDGLLCGKPLCSGFWPGLPTNPGRTACLNSVDPPQGPARDTAQRFPLGARCCRAATSRRWQARTGASPATCDFFGRVCNHRPLRRRSNECSAFDRGQFWHQCMGPHNVHEQGRL